jgi:peptidoglycan/xylan/chitin deacetylase (PgdA/CDA1 family)
MPIKRIVIPIFIILALLVLKWITPALTPTRTVPVQATASLVESDSAPPPASNSVASPASPLSVPSRTPAQSPPKSPTPSPTPEWTWHPPGEVVAPILVYHHIAKREPANRYFLSPAVFEAQMVALQHWGYTSISLSLLVQALTEGAFLPPRPVVITFDDGYRDVYSHAFPILQRLGFTGVVYMIAGQVGLGNYMDSGELSELASAGWEIGSHSWTHNNLRSPGVKLSREIDESRQVLKELLGVPVKTFAFPYGLTSKYVTGLVKEAGYQSAVGLGGSFRHTKKTRYYLSRIEVRSNYDMKRFASSLPWSGDPNDATPPPHEDSRGVDDE